MHKFVIQHCILGGLVTLLGECRKPLTIPLKNETGPMSCSKVKKSFANIRVMIVFWKWSTINCNRAYFVHRELDYRYTFYHLDCTSLVTAYIQSQKKCTIKSYFRKESPFYPFSSTLNILFLLCPLSIFPSILCDHICLLLVSLVFNLPTSHHLPLINFLFICITFQFTTLVSSKSYPTFPLIFIPLLIPLNFRTGPQVLILNPDS